jgi:hypothetical protein
MDEGGRGRAARCLGGAFVPAKGEQPEMILAELDGVLVKASASHEERATVTRIAAPTSGTGGLSFTVLEAGVGPDDLDLHQRDVELEAVVGVEPEVTVWLAGFVVDDGLLHAAIEVAAALCADELRGPAGPYR